MLMNTDVDEMFDEEKDEANDGNTSYLSLEGEREKDCRCFYGRLENFISIR